MFRHPIRLRFALLLTLVALAAACAKAPPPPPPAQPAAATGAGQSAPAKLETGTAGRTADAPPTGEKPVAGGTLKIGAGGPLDSLYPYRFQEAPVVASLYDTLIRYNDQLKPEARLAEKWEFSPDKTKLTFTLRQGVKFHSGKDMTAKDVVYSYNFLLDPKNLSNVGPFLNLVKEVQSPDPRTVVFLFKGPTPAALDIFDLLWIVEDGAKDLQKTAAGTGAFLLKSWVPGNAATLEKNPNYWEQGYPLLDRVEVRVISNVDARTVSLRSGDSDVIEKILIKDVSALRQEGFAAEPSSGNFFDMLMNVTFAPLAKKEVRQAINLTINRERFTRTILQGAVEPACMPYPPTSLGYFADLAQRCKVDVARAKELMARAGYPDGFPVKLLVSAGTAAEAPKLAELIQNDLKQIGIQVDIENVDFAAYQSRQRDSQFELALHNFGFSNRDPGSLYLTASVWKPNANSSKYKNADFSKLVGDAATAADDARRKELYRQIGEHILDDPYVLVFAPSPRSWAWNKKVQGIAWNADAYLQLQRVWIKK